METQTFRQATPDVKHLVFALNPATNNFQMTDGELGFTKVPSELRIEDTQDNPQIKSDYIIRGRIVKRKYSFFTGVIKTKFEDWFFADYFEVRKGIKRNSFILIHFTPEKTTFEMHYFNHLKLYPNRRGYFIREFIESLKK